LQNTLDSIRVNNQIKGISVCIISPGQGTWKGVSGVSHFGVPISSGMEFGIASNTKLFTGVLLLKLVENQWIDLEDPLHTFLPTFDHIDSNITVRQLLNHTSGLADANEVVGYPDSVLSDPWRVFTPSEVMTWVGPPWFAPGTDWGYSNTNYLLAGMIAESATGQPFGQLLHDHILSPLQLDSTFLAVYDSVLYEIAHPWQNGSDNFGIPRTALNSVAWAAGGMYSTAAEMAQWYRALMGGQVLNPASMAELTTFVGTGNYGMGLFETNQLGRTIWHHGGTIWGGYQSSMLYDTASGTIICVLINQNPAQPLLVARQLLAKLIAPSVGLEESPLEKTSLSIFPNPTNGSVNIQISQHHLLGIEIYRPDGLLLRQSRHSRFSIADFPTGNYYIVVRTTKGVFVEKLIKQD
jgi:D-alanyl-D-alanine carboxypeptidase